MNGIQPRSGADNANLYLHSPPQTESSGQNNDHSTGPVGPGSGMIDGGNGTIPQDIKLHSVNGSSIGREGFAGQSKWYQESGGTQQFSLHPGDNNVGNNGRPHSRIEAFTKEKWGPGESHSFKGTFNLEKAQDDTAIFQIKQSGGTPEMMMRVSEDGQLSIKGRAFDNRVVAENILGKDLNLEVRDNGKNWEVIIDGKTVAQGPHATSGNETTFRWGLYNNSPASTDSKLTVRDIELQ